MLSAAWAHEQDGFPVPSSTISCLTVRALQGSAASISLGAACSISWQRRLTGSYPLFLYFLNKEREEEEGKEELVKGSVA